MAAQVVLDTSAVLAVLLGEPGAEIVVPLLRGSILSAVNHAEIGANLSKRGFAREDIERRLNGLVSSIVPFDVVQSKETIRLHRFTLGARLSLADRACLALASLRGLPAMTTDRAWRTLKLGVDIRIIR